MEVTMILGHEGTHDLARPVFDISDTHPFLNRLFAGMEGRVALDPTIGHRSCTVLGICCLINR
jgi:hypothetical protein